MSYVQPELIVVQEITTTAGATDWMTNVLNTLEPGQWAMAPFHNGTDTDNACYYKTASLDFQFDVRLSTALRDINGYVFRPDGYTSSQSEFRVYSLHLKASQGSTNVAKRLAEVTILRDHLNTLPAGSHFMVGGDYNIYTSSESAWAKLTGSEANNNGRVFDPINTVGSWHDNASFRFVHTQSTRTTSLGDGGATGGMDDRFDMILANDDMLDSAGIAFIDGSYVAVGQDGQHFNLAINASPPNASVNSTVANALHAAADHLPVQLEIQLPAKMVVTADLSFGTAIQGYSITHTVTVENPASVPADDLDYSFTVGAGFTPLISSGTVVPGGVDTDAQIMLDTSTPGDKAADVDFVSNAPDTPTLTLPASGKVVTHAIPSVRDDVVLLSESLDFGSHAENEFPDLPALIYNFGYTNLQALLGVTSVSITGLNAARFDVADFSPTEVGAVPATFTVTFDASGAALQTEYTATLTFFVRDAVDVAGGAIFSPITYELTAFVEDTATASPPLSSRVTRLLPNHPNPFNPATTVSFDLAREGRVQLLIFDTRGRLVRRLLNETRDAGRHELVWDGRTDAGAPLASGVYRLQLRSAGQQDVMPMTLVR